MLALAATVEGHDSSIHSQLFTRRLATLSAGCLLETHAHALSHKKRQVDKEMPPTNRRIRKGLYTLAVSGSVNRLAGLSASRSSLVYRLAG
jgi:hypothetical protein